MTVELNVEDIRKRSVLYAKSSRTYHQRMNANAFELCIENPTLLDDKQNLIELCRKKLDNDGYNYSKKRSRSKLFGTGSMEHGSSSKKMKMSEHLRTKKVEELTDDIASLADRIRLLQQQRARDEQLKQYMRASAVEEEITKLRKEKRKHEEEVLLIQKKQAKAKWYKDKQSTSSSSSDGSSSSSSSTKTLTSFWGKSVTPAEPLSKEAGTARGNSTKATCTNQEETQSSRVSDEVAKHSGDKPGENDTPENESQGDNNNGTRSADSGSKAHFL